MFVYVSPGSSFKKKEEGEGGDWILLKSRWRFSLYLILIGNQIQSREKKLTMFSLLRVSIGEGKDAASQILRSSFFIGMSVFFFFFWLNSCACVLFFNIWVFTHGNDFLCLSAPCCPSSIIFMGLVPRTRIANNYILHIINNFPRLFDKYPV